MDVISTVSVGGLGDLAPNSFSRRKALTQDGLIEAIIHRAYYMGWPGTLSAIAVTREIFEK